MNEDAFDQAIDNATQAVIDAFDKEGFALFDDGNMEARADLMIVVSDALAAIMREAIAAKASTIAQGE